MRRFLFILSVIFVSVIGGFAQPNAKEISELRKQINLPEKEIIRPNKDENFSDGQMLKIFSAINYNKSSRRSFEKWVKDWNDENGNKYGKFEIVDKIENADLAVAQFVTKRSKFVREDAVNIGTVPRSGELKPKLRVETESGYKNLNLPVHSYLLVRKNDMWNIVYYDVETSAYGDQLYNPDLSLWNEIKNRMENR